MHYKSLAQRLNALKKEIKLKKVLSASEIESILGYRAFIKKAVQENVLIPLKSGLYHSEALDPFAAGVLAVKRYYPSAILSHLTAMVIHGLSDEILNRVDVDIDRGTTLRNQFLNVHRVVKKKRIGITEIHFQGEKILIYDLERTLCEAYRIDPAGPIFFKALKRYLKNHKPKYDLIEHYDEILNTRVLRHLRQELANG